MGIKVRAVHLDNNVASDSAIASLDGSLSYNSAVAHGRIREGGTVYNVRDAFQINGDTVEASPFAKGDILINDGANTWTALPVGVDGQQLTAASSEISGVKWDDSISTLDTKAGCIAKATFDLDTGVKEATVTFSSAYPDTNYSVTLGVISTDNGSSFAPTVHTKASTGFTISLGTGNTNGLVEVCWQTVNNGEF